MKCKHFEPSQNERALFEEIRRRFFISAFGESENVVRKLSYPQPLYRGSAE